MFSFLYLLVFSFAEIHDMAFQWYIIFHSSVIHYLCLCQSWLVHFFFIPCPVYFTTYFVVVPLLWLRKDVLLLLAKSCPQTRNTCWYTLPSLFIFFPPVCSRQGFRLLQTEYEFGNSDADHNPTPVFILLQLNLLLKHVTVFQIYFLCL